MAINTKMQSLAPRRQVYRKEITLLSGGYTNPKAWPEGRITVYPWDSTVDEYLYQTGRKTNRNLLLIGLLGQVCDLNGGSVDEFVSTEINTVLLTARALSISSDGAVRYTVHCPSCRHPENVTILVPDELEKVGEKGEGYPGYDDITLPDCQDVVRVRPLTLRDEQVILERSPEARKSLSDRKLRILMAVVTVNDGRPDNLDEMVRYYDALSPADVRFLEEEEDRLSPHLNLLIPHQCDECNHQYKYPLGIDTEFFR